MCDLSKWSDSVKSSIKQTIDEYIENKAVFSGYDIVVETRERKKRFMKHSEHRELVNHYLQEKVNEGVLGKRQSDLYPAFVYYVLDDTTLEDDDLSDDDDDYLDDDYLDDDYLDEDDCEDLYDAVGDNFPVLDNTKLDNPKLDRAISLVRDSFPNPNYSKMNVAIDDIKNGKVTPVQKIIDRLKDKFINTKKIEKPKRRIVKLDKRGRVCIPAKFTRYKGWVSGDKVHIGRMCWPESCYIDKENFGNLNNKKLVLVDRNGNIRFSPSKINKKLSGTVFSIDFYDGELIEVRPV